MDPSLGDFAWNLIASGYYIAIVVTIISAINDAAEGLLGGNGMTQDEDKKGPPGHWADLSDDERRVLIEMAKGRLWWEQTLTKLGWLKNLGVVLMGIVLFLTWGRDALAEWLGIAGSPK